MPTLTIKDVPAKLYERLKKSARDHRRSINRQAIVCLEQALTPGRVDPDAFLANLRSLQSRVRALPLTDEFLRRAKNEGRP